jgi:hypothetical protein
MEIKQVTPLQIVDQIEPALPFWKALGFEVRVEVPHGNTLGFVLLGRGSSQLMLQTKASVRADLGEHLGKESILYVDVDDLDAAIALVPNAAVVVPKRDTFYGAREVFVRDAAGTIVGFAAHPTGSEGN